MINLNYIGFVFSNTGYASAARNYILALNQNNNYNIRITPLDFPSSKKIPGKNEDIFKQLITKHAIKDEINVYHSIPELWKRYKSKNKSIGLATFETTDPPKHWIELYNKNDAVIAPSKFILDEFKKAGTTKPIFHISHCLDFSQYNNSAVPMKKHKRFTFMFIGTWKYRKGYKELIQAWKEEFKSNENVQLIIKTCSPKEAHCYLEKELNNNWGRYAPVIIDEKTFTEDEMPSFIKTADCMVSPSYGEGFNLSPLQSMALGISTIITNYSGSTDYANSSTSFLIEPEGFITHSCLDKIPQFMNKKWAYISVPQLRKIMREVYSNKQLREEKIAKAYQFVHENFSYTNINQKFDKMFSELKF